MSGRTGAELLCETLVALGARVVFGVPGTQNVELFDALRRARLRTVLTTNELTAALMAGAYARVSHTVGVVVTIPGPGFLFAVPGLAEARLDSAAVLLIVGAPAAHPGRRFQLQAVDQQAIAAPVVKAYRHARSAADVPRVVRDAWHAAGRDEPGPVVVEVRQDIWGAPADQVATATVHEPAPAADLTAFVTRVARARRPLVLAGQGAVSAAADLHAWVAERRVPVLTTPSARGVVPEDDPLVLGFDPLRSDVAAVNAACEAADLVLALGCKLSHNGSAGFELRLPPDRLVHVDTSADVLNANYPAALALAITSRVALTALRAGPAEPSEWSDADIAERRRAIRTTRSPELPEPRLGGTGEGSAAAFFAAVRRALPRDGIVVTDSGLHQILARRYFDVLAPGGLLLPSDLQTMGFGVPAAVAAKLAAPGRAVTAIVGDGGFATTGAELLTAAREELALVVVVLDDGYLNQIRLQQLREFGHAHGVDLGPLEIAAFARAVGADYLPAGPDIGAAIAAAHGAGRPVVVHVPVADSPEVLRQRVTSAARAVARRALGPALRRWLAALRRR